MHLNVCTYMFLQAVARWRGLVLHEIIHSLGFSAGRFQNARDATGERKNLLAFLPVEDTDGATDMIWHFTKGSRVYDAAQAYFACTDDEAWQGVPLMGLPDLGRNSHWETRIMRDDVMSYGQQSAVSSITLAAMEDLGKIDYDIICIFENRPLLDVLRRNPQN